MIRLSGRATGPITSIKDVVERGLCTGCGTCAGCCPVSAIRMKRRKAVFLPVTDRAKCRSRRGCVICLSVCPGHSIDLDRLSFALFPNHTDDRYLGRFLEVHTGYADDATIRYHAASGGMVTQLLLYLLERRIIDAAVVTRFKKDSPLDPEVCIAGTREEILEARSSKYCPVPLNTALHTIRKEARRVAVVGLPCHIQGLRKAASLYSALNDRIILQLGLYCSSNRTFNATDYLMKLFGIDKEAVQDFSYRDEGCLGNMVVRFKDGSTLRYPFVDYYPRMRSFFIPKRCTLCIDHTSELSDVSFGDIHIPEYWNDKVGISSIIVRSNRARRIIRAAEADGLIRLAEVDRQLIVKSQWPMLERKKHHMPARFHLHRLLGSTTPQYRYHPPRVSRANYMRFLLSSIILYSEIAVGSRHHLWPMIHYLNNFAKAVRGLG
jgi:coenzyme F420 hydrogenase subunit beta